LIKGDFMEQLIHYENISHLLDEIQVDKVYPCSILEGIQSGEIFVNDVSNPHAALFWHYCGFAYIAGKYDANFITEIIEFMRNPRKGHSGRLALQTGNDDLISKLLPENAGMEKKEQYLFDYVGKKISIPQLDEGFVIEKINSQNYELLEGHIIPAFSWESREKFLEKGYGFVILHHSRFVACAFSAGISKEYVDIGVETAEDFKGKGFGKVVTLCMIDEILKRGQKPVWECNTTNEASMRLACAVGFKIKGIHPLWVL